MDEIERYSERETEQKELAFLKTRDISSISVYVLQFIERIDEIESMKEKDGEDGLSSESFQALCDKYSARGLFYFLPITANMQKHPFEKGDILLEDSDYLVVDDSGDAYKIFKGTVELTSDWNPWDCERVKTTSLDNEYGGYYNDTTDDIDDCPAALTLLSDYLAEDMDMAELLNNWNWALEQNFPKKKDENAFTEE